MAEQTKPANYEKALELAETGQYQHALSYLQEYLQENPDDPQALNDSGAILYCLGQQDQAIDYFLRAKNIKPESAEILWNLIEVYLAKTEATEAMKLFDEMEKLRLLNPDVLNRTANILIDQNNKADATEVLLRSIRISPQQEILHPILQVIRSKRPKIAFFCGGDGTTFLKDIYDFIKQRFEVRFFEEQTEAELLELMQWSDISWFEWCTNLAVAGSNAPKVCKNIIRLHRYEAYEQWPQQVNWANVDVLITVGNSFIRDALVKTVPGIENQTSIITIPNGVDVERIEFADHPMGKNIAFYANLRMVKNPAFMLQCLKKLHSIDPEYRLFFGGMFQDKTLEQYIKHMVTTLNLNDAVFFDGYQQDINSWLRDKHFVVSTSIIESQGMSLLECMAAGLKPVIHNFPGADQIFPSEFLFNTPEEFCSQVLSDRYEPFRYRKFVQENYSQKGQLSKINEIFVRFEKELDSLPTFPNAASFLEATASKI